MRRSYRQKRGPGHRENQAGQGLEVHGGGRRQGCSFGSFHHLGVAVGGETRRADAGDDRGSPTRSWTSAKSDDPTHCRPRLRLRSAAACTRPSRDRVDQPSPDQSHPTEDTGRSQAASLPPPLDHRAHDGVVRLVPSADRSIRAFDPAVPRVLSLRIRPDRAQRVMKPLLVSTAKEPKVLEFAVGHGQQAAVCSAGASLRVENSTTARKAPAATSRAFVNRDCARASSLPTKTAIRSTCTGTRSCVAWTGGGCERAV
jgi:hypothetical protein